MYKAIGGILASAIVAALACSCAQAMPTAPARITPAGPGVTLVWGNCGHGYHRNYRGRCVSNYGRTSGCPYGMHLGWNVHRCVPN
jgi:hypothetical protein